MKKLLFITFLLWTQTFLAQFNQDAPWMKDINDKASKSSKPTTFKEIVNAFDNYWKTRNPNVRGSGYKPFKRWENHWKNYVKEDGTLPTASEIWQITIDAKKNETNKNNADASNWISLGPSDFANRSTSSSNIGRVNAIAVDPNNPNTYYAGAPAGGIWKSTDAGSTWTPIGDALPQIGVSGIAVDYNDSNIIYVATGDDDAGDTESVGVLKSTDGGVSWSTTGLNTSNTPSSMNDIYINPNDSNMLWVATNNGVYKTTNGGTNWSIANGTAKLNVKDIKINPSNPDILYIVTLNTFYRSLDGGDTFSNSGVGFGLPASSGRLTLDVTPASPNSVYILSANTSANDYEFQGLYKSTLMGDTFTALATKASVGNIFGSSQAWYDMALAISDSNENEIYTGVLDIHKTTNGGTSFSKINTWYIRNASYTHADIHLLRFFNGALFAGTDGGFFKSVDSGNSFFDLSTGMEISQFYRISASKQTSNKIAGGLQDNGGFGYANNQWNNYHGGDGMETAIDPNNDNLYYSFLYYGQTLFVSSNSGQNEYNGNSLEVDGPEKGEWITPLAINSESEVYGGFSSLYKLCGTSWQLVSPSFGEAADVLAIDELNPDIIFVASGGSRSLAYTNSGNTLWKSTDRGLTFTNIGTFSPAISSIEINHSNSNIVYVTTAGSSGKVLRSNDGGLTFPDNITGTLPNIPKNVIKHQDLHSKNPLYLGTSIGVYRYDDTSGDWELFDNNLPNAPIADLAINLVDGNITAGTYGRGLWRSAIPTETISNEIILESIEGALVSCGNINGLQVKVKNIGSNLVNSINVKYILNGVSNNFDWSGSLPPGNSTLINLPSMTPTIGLQKLEVILSSGSDIYASNNFAFKNFYTNESGTVNTINDFEDVNDELLVFDALANLCGNTGYWERGIASGTLLNTPGNNVYATNLNGNYSDNLKSFLVSKCYNLSILSNPVLKFNMAFDLEENWDVLYVEYSIDSGLNWNILGSATDLNWYNSDRTNASSGIADDCQNCPGAQWTGTNSTMQQYSYNLAALNSETNIVFRFVFHSDQSVNQEGVIIDDLVIEGTTLATPDFEIADVTIYPNPSKNIFNLKTKTIFKFDYTVTDITGKIIVKNKSVETKNNLYQLDMSDFTPGIYFLNITSKSGKLSKKLVLN